ncbi:MAG: hypothetical protein MHPSP_003562, partial [Paramarteilia canceri]
MDRILSAASSLWRNAHLIYSNKDYQLKYGFIFSDDDNEVTEKTKVRRKYIRLLFK